MNRQIRVRAVRRAQLDRQRLVRTLVEAARLKLKTEAGREAANQHEQQLGQAV